MKIHHYHRLCRRLPMMYHTESTTAMQGALTAMIRCKPESPMFGVGN
jgi:hypothetical protein